MHLLGGAKDGVHRAGLDAEGAADAGLFVDHRHHLGLFHPVLLAQRLGVPAQQVGQGQDHRLAAGRALVDVRLLVGDGLGVGAAAGIAALAALGLGQDGVDLVHHRVALHLETDGGIAQQQAEGDGDEGQDHYS